MEQNHNLLSLCTLVVSTLVTDSGTVALVGGGGSSTYRLHRAEQHAGATYSIDLAEQAAGY